VYPPAVVVGCIFQRLDANAIAQMCRDAFPYHPTAFIKGKWVAMTTGASRTAHEHHQVVCPFKAF
jgi:hypothetical protein